MDEGIAAALSTFIMACSTALLMFAAYHWPTGRNQHDDHDNDRDRRRRGRRR